MYIKIIFIFFLLFTSSFAAYEKIRIGKIDSFYKNKLNKKELLQIILEIENLFEKELKINLFDYSKEGKDIDIIYIAPSKIKLTMTNHIKELEKYKKRINKKKQTFNFNEQYIKVFRKELKQNSRMLNKEIKTLNSYIRQINKKKITSKQEYDSIKNIIKNKNIRIKKKKKIFNKLQKEFNTYIKKYNKNVNLNNKLIYKHNILHHKVKSLQKSFKDVKGLAISNKRIEEKTYYKNGKRIKEKTIKNIYKKIEIYSFESLKELKAIIAHEILHLLGLKHINIKGALMNPVLQKNQIKELKLTKEDIKLIKKVFK